MTTIGHALSLHRPLFSSDGKLLLVCSGSSISIYVVKTGIRVGRLVGHTGHVTGIVGHPENNMCVISASLDGKLRVWDVYEGTCLRVLDVSHPVVEIVAVDGKAKAKEKKVVFVMKQMRDTGARKVFEVSLETGQSKFLFDAGVDAFSLAVSPNGNYLAVIQKTKFWVCTVASGKISKHRHIRALTALAFHPNDPYIATAACDGQIILWYGFASAGADSQISTSVFHWHAASLTGIAFSEDGAYLLSAGQESVLVSWHLESGNRQFLPRIGGMISSIAVGCKGCVYALCCADNSIKLINAISSRVEKTIRGYLNSSLAVDQQTSLNLVAYPSSEVVVSSSSSMLQFFNVFADSHTSELDVAPRNQVLKIDKQKPLLTILERVAFSYCGTWLATVEQRYREEEKRNFEKVMDEEEIKFSTFDSLVLKFWVFEKEFWTLTSRIDLPHKSKITSACFCPKRNDLVLTASLDGNFKIWTRAAPIASMDSLKVLSWTCQSVGYYQNELSISSASFGDDGSVFAIACNSFVSLWETTSLKMIHVFDHPQCKILRVAFIPCTPFLVTSSADRIFVWNVLSLDLAWSYELKVLQVAAAPPNERDNDTGAFVVITQFKRDSSHFAALIFRPDSAIPLKIVPIKIRKAALLFGAAFVLSSGKMEEKTLSLVISTDCGDLLRYDFILSVKDTTSNTKLENKKHATLDIESENLFERLYGSLVSEPAPSQAVQLVQQPSAASNFVFSSQTHVLPSLSNLYSSFIDRMLVKKQIYSTEANINLPEMKVADMDIVLAKHIVVNNESILFSVDEETALSQIFQDLVLEECPKGGSGVIVPPSVKKTRGRTKK